MGMGTETDSSLNETRLEARKEVVEERKLGSHYTVPLTEEHN